MYGGGECLCGDVYVLLLHVSVYGATFYFPILYNLISTQYKARQAKNIEEDAQKNLGRKTSHKKFILNIKAPILANPMHVAQPSSSANEHKKRSEV